jgi:hypothetical protein
VDYRWTPKHSSKPGNSGKEADEEMMWQSALVAFLLRGKATTVEKSLKARLSLLGELDILENLNDVLDHSGNMTNLKLKSVLLKYDPSKTK